RKQSTSPRALAWIASRSPSSGRAFARTQTREKRSEIMFEKGLLSGKRVLVTGGGSGLGAAMGRRFLELGADLIICGRKLELLETTAAEMRAASGASVSAIRCDIRDGASVDAMMDSIWRETPI